MREFNKHDHRANWSDSRATASGICPQTSAPIVLIHCWTRTSKCRFRRDADDCCYLMCWWWCPGPAPNHCCRRFVPAAADGVAVCVTTKKWPQWRPPERWSRAHRTRSPTWRWTSTVCPRPLAYAHAARNLRLKRGKKERYFLDMWINCKIQILSKGSVLPDQPSNNRCTATKFVYKSLSCYYRFCYRALISCQV